MTQSQLVKEYVRLFLYIHAKGMWYADPDAVGADKRNRLLYDAIHHALDNMTNAHKILASLELEEALTKIGVWK